MNMDEVIRERAAVSAARKKGLVLGTRVECRYGGSANFYWGKINWINDNGTFDILYQDGDQEFEVARHLFRKDRGLAVGDVVEARSDEDNRFIECVVSKVHRFQLYDLVFDDFVRERVRRVLIRRRHIDGY